MERNYTKHKIYLPYYNTLRTQDLWQAHYQVLSIVFLMECIELSINSGAMIKKCETCAIKYKYWDCFH